MPVRAFDHMQRAARVLIFVMVLVFVTSGLNFALLRYPEQLIPSGLTGIPVQPDGLVSIYLRPQQPAMWLMLVCLWLALLIFATRQIGRDQQGRAEGSLADQALLSAALGAGAIWPWISTRAPVTGFLLCVLMLLALITATGRTHSDGRLGRNPLVAVFTGWATILTFAAFASFLSDFTPVPIELSMLVSALLTCAAAIAIQMRMPATPTYTITVIFAFLATAATSIEASPPVAVIAVLSIAALTFLLVRVTS
ncbi:MAG: hypothetical protein Q4G25_07145 [Paracoccus sp. (in: a-proteobacteria)]|nr:hypothetical protein [Paracoccus sp. (in: a-proteobacteria)]